MGRFSRSTVALVVAVLLSTRSVNAQERDVPAVELSARMAVLDAYLSDIEKPSRRHYVTWLSLLGAAFTAQTALLASAVAPETRLQELANTRRERTNFAVGAALSLSGVLSVLFTPHPGRYASRRYRKLPDATFAERRAKIARGERWLAEEARSVRFMRSWLPQIGAVLVGVGAGVALGCAFEDNWLAGARVGIGALIVQQARVWTRPDRSTDYLKRYRSAPTRAQFGFSPWAAPQVAGAGLDVRF